MAQEIPEERNPNRHGSQKALAGGQFCKTQKSSSSAPTVDHAEYPTTASYGSLGGRLHYSAPVKHGVGRLVRARTRKYKPEPGPKPKANVKPKSCPKNPKVKLDLRNLTMLPSYFYYIFVHLKQKARFRPKISPKFLSTLSPNPARTRPEKPGPTSNSAIQSKFRAKQHCWVSNASKTSHN